MADLTLRNVKGSSLTFTEMDSNFLALDSDITNLFAVNSTTNLSEGSNLYYTDARVSSLVDSDYINSRGAPTVGAQTIYKYKTGSALPGSTEWGFNDSAGTGLPAQIDSDGTGYIRFNRYNANTADVSNFLKKAVPVGSTIYIQEKQTSTHFVLLETTTTFANAQSDFTVQVANCKIKNKEFSTQAFANGKECIVMIQAQSSTVNDSSEVISIINSTVNKSFVDALNVDADTVDGFHGIGLYDSAGTLLNG